MDTLKTIKHVLMGCGARTTTAIRDFKFDHLEENKMSYCSHFCRAFRIGATMVWSGSLTMIHATWPDIFLHAATNRVALLQNELAEELQAKKAKEELKTN